MNVLKLANSGWNIILEYYVLTPFLATAGKEAGGMSK
jgi:hypothetical protein